MDAQLILLEKLKNVKLLENHKGQKGKWINNTLLLSNGEVITIDKKTDKEISFIIEDESTIRYSIIVNPKSLPSLLENDFIQVYEHIHFPLIQKSEKNPVVTKENFKEIISHSFKNCLLQNFVGIIQALDQSQCILYDHETLIYGDPILNLHCIAINHQDANGQEDFFQLLIPFLHQTYKRILIVALLNDGIAFHTRPYVQHRELKYIKKYKNESSWISIISRNDVQKLKDQDFKTDVIIFERANSINMKTQYFNILKETQSFGASHIILSNIGSPIDDCILLSGLDRFSFQITKDHFWKNCCFNVELKNKTETVKASKKMDKRKSDIDQKFLQFCLENKDFKKVKTQDQNDFKEEHKEEDLTMKFKKWFPNGFKIVNISNLVINNEPIKKPVSHVYKRPFFNQYVWTQAENRFQ